MARNCAVIVGINDYDEISPLKYAKSDAERMRDFFMQDLGVSQDDLYFFTDDSPRNALGRKTQPTYGTLKSFLGDRFADPFLSAGDTLWFYFSGHGMPYEGRDYLLPSDGNPRSIPDLAIPIGYVTERLRRSGADNVVMLIDACRSDGAKNAGMGIGEEKQQGVITFFSCSPSQVSYEIDEIGQGAFTNVLLEALRIQGEGNCATVERFANYLKARVPQLTERYKSYAQTPYVVIEPETKLHYILLPRFANLTDITLLKVDALHAEAEGDFGLAFQLWMRVNVAASGTDMQAINAFQRLTNKQVAPSSQPKEGVSDLGSKAPLAMRTFTTSTVGKEKVNKAFRYSGKTQEFIAGKSGTTRQTVNRFLHGDSIKQSIFIAICEALELRWQEIAELQESEFIKDRVSDLGSKVPLAMRTFTTSTVGKEKVNAAFRRSGKTQEFIAGESGTTRKTVSRFLQGNSIEKSRFIAICEALGLRWQEIAELQESAIIEEEVSDWGNKTPSVQPIPEVKKNPVELVSAKGIDYRELENLLKAQEWRKADELTAKLMYQVSNREHKGWLDIEQIKAFPCEDLRIIDQLWMHYSNSKFGFSIQKKFWLECGGEIGKYDHEVWKKFAEKVGWYHPQNDDWRTYTEFMNDMENIQTALPASLPLRIIEERRWVGGLGKLVEALFSSLAQRLMNCNR